MGCCPTIRSNSFSVLKSPMSRRLRRLSQIFQPISFGLNTVSGKAEDLKYRQSMI